MNVKQLIPQPVKTGIRRVIDTVNYKVGSAVGTWDPLVPPPSLHGVGGHFHTTGHEFMRYFTGLGELKPTDRVLDIGSGTGRMAIRIKDYLTTGTYDGTEIVGESVDWCNQAYAKYPNFRFHHSDVFNEFYNPRGPVLAADYKFPFPDASFDFIFLTSVFTHMFPKDVENYLAEVKRMLAPGGRVLVTVFLLNEETRALMGQGKSRFDFRFPVNDCWTAFDDRPPESAIAFEEDQFRRMVEAQGLEITSLNFGNWRGKDGLTIQDLLILRHASQPG